MKLPSGPDQGVQKFKSIEVVKTLEYCESVTGLIAVNRKADQSPFECA